MRKIYTALLAVLFHVVAFAQTDITIGTGTSGNTSTGYPCPLQDYYEGSRMQFLYTAAELNAAGMTAGTITGLKFNITALNGAGVIEQLSIKIDATSTQSLSSSSWETVTNTVFGPADYQPVLDSNVFAFTAPFVWNGVDNVVVEICNGDPNNASAVTYTNNPTIFYTTGLGFNGSHTYRADNLGNLCDVATTTNTGSQTTRPDITFKWSPATAAGCYPPSGLTMSNIGTSSATATWNAPTVGSIPAGYSWEVRRSGAAGSGSAGLVASGSTTSPSTTATVSSLSPSTTYKFYVRSNCSATDSSAWAGASFLTACAVVSNFYEGFDSVTVPSLPVCWTRILRGSTISTSASVTTTSTAANVYSPTKAVSMYNSNSGASDDIILVSPQLNNLDSANHRLTFYAKNSVATQEVEVGTLSDTTSNATFNLIETVDIGTTYQKYIVNFNNYNGTDQYIGIRRQNSSTYSYVYLDDITWEKIPSCVEPTGLIVSSVTSSGAMLDWTASISTASSYEIYVSPSATAPTSTSTPTVTGVTGTTYTLSNLTSATKYYVYVRANCGAGGTSTWSTGANFTTECLAVNAFAENFDSVKAPALPTCWSKILRGGTLSTFATVTTDSFSTVSLKNEVNMYNSSSTSTDDIILVSPPVNNLTSGTMQLVFYARNTTASQDIEVGTLDNNTPNAVFTPVQTVDVTTTYQKFIVSLASANPTDQYIGFRRLNTSTYSNVYIDNVSWEVIPACSEPTGVTIDPFSVTTNSAIVSWTAPLSAPAAYDVYYSTSNVTPDTSATPSITGVNSTSTDLINLTPSTTYYVWVRSSCGAAGHSIWSTRGSFTTACGVVIAPTAGPETFDQFPVNCWSQGRGLLANPTVFTTTTTSSWGQANFANNSTLANKAARLNIYGTGTTRMNWLFTPVYDLGTTADKRLEFDLALTHYNNTNADTLGADDKFAVVISTDQGATWSDANVLRMWDTLTPISATGEHIVIDLANYSGQVMFGFYGESTVANEDNDVFVDNVAVTTFNIVPVSLVTFKGERRGAENVLVWKTATEQNNKGFELQRSINGADFSTIAFVRTKSATGNSNAALDYTYNDKTPFMGNSYYRLKQINNDNKTSLSNIVVIKGTRSTGLVLSSIYPNPASDAVNMVVSAPSSDKITFIVSDLAGKVVMQKAATMNSGDNNVKLNVQTLPSGTYMLKAVCANGCETAVSKFVKQ